MAANSRVPRACRVASMVACAMVICSLPVPVAAAASARTELVAAAEAEPALTLAAAEVGEFGDFGDLDLSALLDVTVESASRKKESISDAAAVIEVISRQDLRRWGVTNLYQAIENIVGVEVIENYFGQTQIIIRGSVAPLHNSQVLLLIDEIPVYEIGNMHMYLEQLPLNAVERVEVIRGPGAVLYGTNAYAGVISVFTRKPERTEGNIHVRGGVQASGGGWADSAYVWDSGYVRASVQVERSPEYTARAIGELGNPSEFTRVQTDVATYLQFEQRLDEHTFRVRGNYFRQEKLKWGIFPIAAIEQGDNVNQAMFVDGSYNWRRGGLSVDAALTYYRIFTNGSWARSLLWRISPRRQERAHQSTCWHAITW